MFDMMDSASFGRMKVIRLLGRGGMASVYLAEMRGDNGFKRRVALKVIEMSRTGTGLHLETWFANEARLGGLLRHDHIASTLDFGRTEGMLYLAMEYVDGPSLDDVQSTLRREGATMPPDIALQIFDQLCEGMEFAHRARSEDGEPLRVVHRDLKPSNLMFTAGGTLKICDFGISRAASNEDQTKRSGVIKGTYRYMSPEQAYGHRELDHRSDLFSMAAILYEMLAGCALYTAAVEGLLLRAAQDADVQGRIDALPSTLPERALFQRFFQRALAAEPAARFQSASEMQEALEPIVQHLPRTQKLKRWLTYHVEQKQAQGHHVRLESGSSSGAPQSGSRSSPALSTPEDSPTTTGEGFRSLPGVSRPGISQPGISQPGIQTRLDEHDALQATPLERLMHDAGGSMATPAPAPFPSTDALRAATAALQQQTTSPVIPRAPIERKPSHLPKDTPVIPPRPQTHAGQGESEGTVSTVNRVARNKILIAVLAGVGAGALFLMGVYIVTQYRGGEPGSGREGISTALSSQPPTPLPHINLPADAPPAAVLPVHTEQTQATRQAVEVATRPKLVEERGDRPKKAERGAVPAESTGDSVGSKPQEPPQPLLAPTEPPEPTAAPPLPTAAAQAERAKASILTVNTKGEVKGVAYLDDAPLGGSFPIREIPLTEGRHKVIFGETTSGLTLTKVIHGIPGRKVTCVADFDRLIPDLLCQYGAY